MLGACSSSSSDDIGLASPTTSSPSATGSLATSARPRPPPRPARDRRPRHRRCLLRLLALDHDRPRFPDGRARGGASRSTGRRPRGPSARRTRTGRPRLPRLRPPTPRRPPALIGERPRSARPRRPSRPASCLVDGLLLGSRDVHRGWCRRPRYHGGRHDRAAGGATAIVPESGSRGRIRLRQRHGAASATARHRLGPWLLAPAPASESG